MNKVNVNKVVDYANLLKENELLHSIIKEVREYINNSIDYQYIDLTIDSVVEDINEILDKVEENTNGKL